ALIAVAPDEELVKTFGKDKPRYGQLHVCYAESEEQARKTAHELWPNAAMGGALGQELATTEHYETVAEDDVAEEVVCGPDPQKYLDAIKEYEDAGFTHVFVHQIGQDQAGFLKFYAEQILPEL